MIIDQLPLLSGNAASTDECPIERGTTTYKVTVERLLAALPKDTVPTQGSSNAVESGGVYDALATKQNALTFDSAPTQGSSNPVTSGGVYTAIENATPEGFVSYAEAQTLTTAQQKQARDNIGADWVLLWQNASPTSSFSPQTISVALAEYDFFAVAALSERTSAQEMQISIIDKSASYSGSYISTDRTWTNGGGIYQRFFNYTDTTIAWESGRRLSFNTPNSVMYGTGDDYIIPQKIYGLKRR